MAGPWQSQLDIMDLTPSSPDNHPGAANCLTHTW